MVGEGQSITLKHRTLETKGKPELLELKLGLQLKSPGCPSSSSQAGSILLDSEKKRKGRGTEDS